MPIAAFDAVYLVDLCKPLLEVARKRFKERRWKNVHVVHCDATKFELPLDKYGRQCKAALITMSYSLSMVSSMMSVEAEAPTYNLSDLPFVSRSPHITLHWIRCTICWILKE